MEAEFYFKDEWRTNIKGQTICLLDRIYFRFKKDSLVEGSPPFELDEPATEAQKDYYKDAWKKFVKSAEYAERERTLPERRAAEEKRQEDEFWSKKAKRVQVKEPSEDVPAPSVRAQQPEVVDVSAPETTSPSLELTPEEAEEVKSLTEEKREGTEL